jgi:hypothetical protein
MQTCPVDCALDDWTSWSACSVSCGGPGTSSSIKTVLVAPQGSGESCTATVQTRSDCGLAACPVDCVLSSWDGWSTCTASCGSGAASRTRAISTNPSSGGQMCDATKETSPCSTQMCPTDCAVTAWASWTACTTACAGTLSLTLVSNRLAFSISMGLQMGHRCGKSLLLRLQQAAVSLAH